MYEKFSFKEIADAYITQGKASQKAIEGYLLVTVSARS